MITTEVVCVLLYSYSICNDDLTLDVHDMPCKLQHVTN